MKRLFWATTIALVLYACATVSHPPIPGPIPLPGLLVLEAQTLPLTKTLAWDAEDPSLNVTLYTVSLDGAVVGNPTGTTQSVTFTTQGVHTLSVTATNAFGVSAPATLSVNVLLPAPVKNLRLQ